MVGHAALGTLGYGGDAQRFSIHIGIVEKYIDIDRVSVLGVGAVVHGIWQIIDWIDRDRHRAVVDPPKVSSMV